MNAGQAEPAEDPSPVLGLTEVQLWPIVESTAIAEIEKALAAMR